jgi:hypothetical protein
MIFVYPRIARDGLFAARLREPRRASAGIRNNAETVAFPFDPP